MSFFVYILYSKKYNRYYIGQTYDLEMRISRHNNGYELATKSYVPWEIECSILKSSRAEAMILEKKLKNLNKSKLKAFIAKYRNSVS